MGTLRITRSLARKVLLVLIVLAVVGAAAIVARDYLKKDDDAAQNDNQCVSKELEAEYLSAFSSFDGTDVAKVAEVVKEIKSKPEHKESANCLYIVGKYSKDIGLYDQALEYNKALLELNKQDKQWFDATLGTEQPKDIEGTVKVLSTQQASPMNVNKIRPVPLVEKKQ